MFPLGARTPPHHPPDVYVAVPPVIPVKLDVVGVIDEFDPVKLLK